MRTPPVAVEFDSCGAETHPAFSEARKRGDGRYQLDFPTDRGVARSQEAQRIWVEYKLQHLRTWLRSNAKQVEPLTDPFEIWRLAVGAALIGMSDETLKDYADYDFRISYDAKLTADEAAEQAIEDSRVSKYFR